MTGGALAEHTVAALRRSVMRWRTSWSESSLTLRTWWSLSTALSAIGALVLAFQFGGERLLVDVAGWTYAILPASAGLLLMFASRKTDGPGASAWWLIGLGVAFWGLGELIWTYYGSFLEVEVPYPGWADVFYVGSYPILLVGVLLLPHVQPRKWDRIRVGLDAVAGTFALAAIAWTFYLKDTIYVDPEVGLLENFVNVAYPVGDAMLLGALMILLTRRSRSPFDGRVLLLGLGMLITTFADLEYVLQVDAGTYVIGGRLDAMWLISYGLFGFVALAVAAPVDLKAELVRQRSMWSMVAPYSVIIGMLILTVVEEGDRMSVLQWATVVTGLWIVARQSVAIREYRHISEQQRHDLIASISHELRTPLAAVTGFTQVLNDDPDLDRAERVEMISIVNAQANHLARIVGDLVDAARDQLESTTLHRTDLDVGDLVRSAVAMARGDERALDTHVVVDVEDGLAVEGDLTRLRQVLVNYITNAGRYGGGRIEVRAFGTDDQVVVEVHDDGPGVPKKHEVAIWDRFDRGAHAQGSEVRGSGLGLAIVRQLVSAHGGRTGQHRSPTLGGACFWLALPRRSTMAPVEEEASAV